MRECFNGYPYVVLLFSRDRLDFKLLRVFKGSRIEDIYIYYHRCIYKLLTFNVIFIPAKNFYQCVYSYTISLY